MTGRWWHSVGMMGLVAGVLLTLSTMGVAKRALGSTDQGMSGAGGAYGAARVPSLARDQAQALAPKVYVGLFKDDAVGVIDTAANREVATIPVPAGPHGLVVTPDGRRVYVSSDAASTVSVIDTETDQVVDTIDVGETPHGLSISRDGRSVVVSGFGTNQVEMIDTASDRIMASYPVGAPHNTAISSDGRIVYAGSQQRDAPAIVVLDVSAGSPVATLPLSSQPRALALSPDDRELYFTLVGSSAIQVLDTASLALTGEIAVGASPHQPMVMPDGRTALVVAQGPGELDFVDVARQEESAAIATGTFPHWMALSAAGDIAYVTNEGSNDVAVVDLRTQSVRSTIPVGNAPRKIAVQPVTVSAGGSASPVNAAEAGQRLQAAAVAAQSDRELDATGLGSIAIVADDYAFTPSVVHGTPGQRLTIEIENRSGTLHNFTVSGQADADIAPYSRATVQVELPTTGELRYFCEYHTALGMNGQLIAGTGAP